VKPLRVLLAVAFGIVSVAAHAQDVLDLASFRLGAELAPPPFLEGEWSAVPLPDRWDERRPGASGLGWYRLVWGIDELPAERQAIYLEHASMNAAVFVNGEWIGSSGRMTPPVAQNWHRPLLFDFSARLLHPGENEIHVQLYRLPDCYGGLGPVRAGALATLEPLHRVRFLWQIEATRAASILAGVVALVMAVLWLGARDSTYGWFGSVSALLGVQSLSYHVRDIPVASQTWEAIGGAAGLLAAPAFAVFARRLASWPRSRRELSYAAYALAVLPLFALSHLRFHAWFNALAVGAVALAALSFAPVYAYATRTSRALVAMHVALAAAIVGVIARDVGIQLGWVAQPTIHGMPLIAPLLIAGFAATLLLRFARAFREAEIARAQLAERVREKHAELDASFARLRGAERSAAVAEERERLMREMHDGVGSSLVRAIALVERRAASPDQIVETLRAALEDMRIAIDSLDPAVRDVDDILAVLRDRLAPRLERSGVVIEWRLADVAPLGPLSAEGALDLLRICQEAIANAISHGKARRIRIATSESAAASERCVVIAIEDDGVGLPSDAHEGRGFANMRFRASRLGAELRVDSERAGTRVELRLPRAPAALAPQTSA
jgi:signal transduction histidine kinase